MTAAAHVVTLRVGRATALVLGRPGGVQWRVLAPFLEEVMPKELVYKVEDF